MYELIIDPHNDLLSVGPINSSTRRELHQHCRGQGSNPLSGLLLCCLKPGFHIVVSVVRKKFIGQIQLYGNLPYKCSIQKKRRIELVVPDRMNSICPINFFRTTDTTDTTIWKPGLINKASIDLFVY